MPTFDVPVVGRKDGIIRKLAFQASTIEDAYQQAQDEGHIVQAPAAPSHPAQPANSNPDLFRIHTDIQELRQLIEQCRLVTSPEKAIASGILRAVWIYAAIALVVALGPILVLAALGLIHSAMK